MYMDIVVRGLYGHSGNRVKVYVMVRGILGESG